MQYAFRKGSIDFLGRLMPGVAACSADIAENATAKLIHGRVLKGNMSGPSTYHKRLAGYTILRQRSALIESL